MDEFDNFRKWQLNFGSWKTGKSYGRGHGKSWNLKSSKEYEDWRMGRLNTFFAPYGLHLPTIRIILLQKVSLTFLGEKM